MAVVHNSSFVIDARGVIVCEVDSIIQHLCDGGYGAGCHHLCCDLHVCGLSATVTLVSNKAGPTGVQTVVTVAPVPVGADLW